MQKNPELLRKQIQTLLGNRFETVELAFGQVTITVSASNYHDVMQTLRDDPQLRFEQLIDLCGMDYLGYADQALPSHRRYAAVSQLLSITHNVRVRVRVFTDDDENPCIASVCDIWPSVNWFEREAFDLYGILFDGHPDLRRILTDYGFVGYPFRKDFPVQGYMEMRYDETLKRIVYQPVSIEPREITPRVIQYPAKKDE